jgi:hypothetical protein
MINYIDLKLKCIAGHAETVINGRRIKCAADYGRVLGHVMPAALREFGSQLSMINAMLCWKESNYMNTK